MTVRLLIGMLSAAVMIWGILPLFSKMFNSGMVTLMASGVIGVCISVWYPSVQEKVTLWWQNAIGRVVLILLVLVVAGVVVLFIAVSVRMVMANKQKPSRNATVVVLGAALRGDRPSRSLRIRLDAAAQYLRENPAAVCVVAGGQGRDESCTEAAAMYRYLLEIGVAANRVHTEERSTSTYENIVFSKALIEEKGLPSAIAIATQEFHQYRAQWFAARAGLTDVGAVTARSRWDVLGCYWIRDFYGVCRMYIAGE